MIWTAVLRLCGHEVGGPSGVCDQSISRSSRPVSPPVAKSSMRFALSIDDPMYLSTRKTGLPGK